MELNSEQIKKALECCTKGLDCEMCPLFKAAHCSTEMQEAALALITSQEQKIGELTKENEIFIAAMKSDRLELVDFAVGKIREERADTVRKMQERLKDLFPYDADSGLYVAIDQIAKEMEGEWTKKANT